MVNVINLRIRRRRGMSTVDKELLQKQLNKSTEILEMTFDMFNLQVMIKRLHLRERNLKVGVRVSVHLQIAMVESLYLV